MTTDVLVLGLDAASTPLLEVLMAEGRLPNLAAVVARSAHTPLATCLDTLPGGVWPELSTGMSAGRMGLYYHWWQIHTGEAYGRRVTEDDVQPARYFFNVAARAGRRVGVVDWVQATPDEGADTVAVFEWGLHDRSFAIRSRPPALIDELRARHGDHPIDSCDREHGGTAAGYARFRDKLIAGARTKGDLAGELLEREHWDLFAVVLGEPHCAGHQLWHLHDPSHPDHDPNVPDGIGDGLEDVYGEVDRTVGRLITIAGPDATVVLFTSHGMDVPTGGFQLMGPIVERLGLGNGAPRHASVRRVVPAPVRRLLRTVVPKTTQERHKLQARELEADGTLAIAVKNNRCGAIRLNLVGREPHGVVAPGVEADELVARIKRELHALVDPAGRSVVLSVRTATEAFGPDHHPDTPDILVDFRSDLGIIDTAESPTIGRVHVPVRNDVLPRTGDHVDNSHLWVSGPGAGAPGPVAIDGAASIDVPPTVLALLGIEPPAWVEGRPLRGLLAEAELGEDLGRVLAHGGRRSGRGDVGAVEGDG